LDSSDSSAAAARLAELLADGGVLALTGAGISTDSGIPDYRGPTAPRRTRPPMQFREFAGSAEARARYWARSLAGWPRIDGARPNEGHRALAELEARGLVAELITQNVDRLHQRAGHQNVIELHGALAEVRCLGCGALSARQQLQEQLLAANPGWSDQVQGILQADGDAELDGCEGFVVPACPSCGGVLKPHVVFFGENVPPLTTAAAWAALDRARALVVLGSSLTVFSGYRFVRRAAERGMPIAIVNHGPTRGDGEATLRIEGSIAEVLPRVLAALHR
jgi:NAD-dependent deacetylase sirtuin 4